jgi:hypothetical protein
LLLFNAFKKGGRFAAVVVVPNCCPIPEGGRFAALVVVPNCPKETNYFAFKKAAASVRSCCYLLPSKRRPLRARSCCYLLPTKRQPLRARSCCYLFPIVAQFKKI